MSARNHILGRLRAATIDTPPALPNVTDWYASHRRHETPSQRCTRLRTALEAVHAEVHDTSTADWPELLLRIAATKGLRNLLIGTDTTHGAALEARQPDQLKVLHYTQAIEAWRDTLFDGVDASLTLARSAIAETGSLVLWPSASEPRLMSLVPPVSFILLDTATIHPDLHTALSAEGWKDGMPTNALLVCGPSKTADIQQTLAYGAHGPRELVVLLCHPQGAPA